MTTNVSIGPATIVGYFLSALGAAGTALAAVEGNLAGPGKWLAILTVITAVATNFNRSFQAASQPQTPGIESDVEKPNTLVDVSKLPVDPLPVAGALGGPVTVPLA
jgi:hypothetical protein